MSITASEARKNLFGLIKEINESSQPVNITSRQGNAVLISESDWNSVQETLYLYSIPKMKDSIDEGINTPAEECTPLNKVQW